MTGAPIPSVENPVMPGLPEEMQRFLNGLASEAQAGSNWMVRKKILLDALVAVEKLASLSEEERDSLLGVARERLSDSGPDVAGGDEEEGGDDDVVPSPAMLVLLYCGAVLETMNESEIRSAEQAALYALSIHPAHNRAAVDWAQSDPRNGKAMRKLFRHDRRFKQLFDAVSSMIGTGPDDGMGASLA